MNRVPPGRHHRSVVALALFDGVPRPEPHHLRTYRCQHNQSIQSQRDELDVILQLANHPIYFPNIHVSVNYAHLAPTPASDETSQPGTLVAN